MKPQINIINVQNLDIYGRKILLNALRNSFQILLIRLTRIWTITSMLSLWNAILGVSLEYKNQCALFSPVMIYNYFQIMKL